MKIVKLETIQNCENHVQFVIVNNINNISNIENLCKANKFITDYKVSALDQFDFKNTLEYVLSHMTWNDYKYMHMHLDEIEID
jgi:hypothetical protein